MKLQTLQENLASALATAVRGAATKTTLPITQNVLIEAVHGQLKLTTTNLEIGIVRWIGAQIEEDGAITVPARMFHDVVRTLPTELVSLSAESGSLRVKCGKVKAQINGRPAEDFPPIPSVDTDTALSIDPDALRSAISRTAFAAATGYEATARPVLSCIYIELEGDTATFTTTDGHRLANMSTILAGSVSEPLDILVPATSMIELERIIRTQADPIEISVNTARSQVVFKGDNVEMFALLMGGSFPNYKKLIPTEFATRIAVDKAALEQAVNGAAVIARNGSGVLRFQTDGDTLNVSASSDETGDISLDVEAKVDGGPNKIALTASYVIEAIDVVQGDSVLIEMNSPSQPALITGTDDHRQMIMAFTVVNW